MGQGSALAMFASCQQGVSPNRRARSGLRGREDGREMIGVPLLPMKCRDHVDKLQAQFL